ncbi:MAG: hypothetical protein M1831_001325 [Alyxoria varia]|nr:MAG: hypothetical protein M1831_001325 [Alyxoria varia]
MALLKVLEFLISATVLYSFGLAVYRIQFHPLAAFPGPRFAAITYWWEFYQDYCVKGGGTSFIELDKLHEKYGPIVRIRPNELHVKDSNWYKTLYPGPGHTILHKALAAERASTDRKDREGPGKSQQPSNLIERIVDSDLPPEERRPSRIIEEVLVLLVAGGLPVANAASVAVYHVLNDPRLKMRIQGELIQRFPNLHDTIPANEELQALPLLSAMVKEALRIGDVLIARDPLIAETALQYDSWTIPAGAAVSMTFVKSASDPGIFTNPARFDPDRWL